MIENTLKKMQLLMSIMEKRATLSNLITQTDSNTTDVEKKITDIVDVSKKSIELLQIQDELIGILLLTDMNSLAENFGIDISKLNSIVTDNSGFNPEDVFKNRFN